MVTAEAIDTALSAHAQWKKRLQDAVTTGKSEFSPLVVARDDACPFGKWLYSLDANAKAGASYAKVKALHAEFHSTAGEILELALTGKTDDALKHLGWSGKYAKASGKLVLAMQSWKSEFQAAP